MSDEKEAETAQRRRQEAEARLRALAHQDGLSEAAQKTVTEQRVDVIVGMMVDGRWVSGRSDRQLGMVWNLKPARMAIIAAEANRVIRRAWRESPRHKKALLARGLMTFDRICNKAEEIGGPNGLRVAMDAMANLLTFSGMKPAQKQEHAGPGGKPLDHAQVLILPPKEPEEEPAAPDGSPATSPQ